MACSKVEAPNGVCPPGKHQYMVWRSLFEIDTRYVPIKAIGKGAYGVVCSARDLQQDEKDPTSAVKQPGNGDTSSSSSSSSSQEGE